MIGHRSSRTVVRRAVVSAMLIAVISLLACGGSGDVDSQRTSPRPPPGHAVTPNPAPTSHTPVGGAPVPSTPSPTVSPTPTVQPMPTEKAVRIFDPHADRSTHVRSTENYELTVVVDLAVSNGEFLSHRRSYQIESGDIAGPEGGR